MIIAIIVLVIIVVLVILAVVGFNKLRQADVSAQEALGGIDVQLTRRADLVPNLVETVKGYAAHEKETLSKVVEARASISQMKISSDVVSDPAALEKFQASQGVLSSALSRLLVVAEQYPDLKASQNFLALQSQLEGTENRITVERMRFNEAAQKFNTLRRTFPAAFVANMMGFKEKAYFQADAAAAKAPSVKF